MYLLYDADTGAITGYSETEPQEGAWATIPFSAMQTPPLTHWSETAKGFVDGAGPLEWNGTAFVADLNALKIAKRVQVNARKDLAEVSGTTCLYGPLDTTEASQRKITGLLVKAGLFPANFSDKWTMANDVDLTIDASMAAVIGLAIGDHVSACHSVSRELKAQIAAATSVEELDGIDIEGADWP